MGNRRNRHPWALIRGRRFTGPHTFPQSGTRGEVVGMELYSGEFVLKVAPTVILAALALVKLVLSWAKTRKDERQ